jgi:hypothetical protein
LPLAISCFACFSRASISFLIEMSNCSMPAFQFGERK